MAIRSIIAAALVAFVSAASAGDFDTGVLAYTRGDFARALHEFRSPAEEGHTEAAFLLGVMYRQGKGMAKNLAEASAGYRKAADQGHAEAQFSSGAL